MSKSHEHKCPVCGQIYDHPNMSRIGCNSYYEECNWCLVNKQPQTFEIWYNSKYGIAFQEVKAITPLKALAKCSVYIREHLIEVIDQTGITVLGNSDYEAIQNQSTLR